MIASWPLTGRREELSLIERTLSDGQFRGLLLAGAPGVDKTRLAREALTAAAVAGCFTRWAATSRAVAAIPFGVLAHLSPFTGDNSTHLQVRQQAAKWMATQAGGRRLGLGINDAHIPDDDASAALLFHLVINGTASVVATLPTGEPAPGLVTALWKEGVAERLETQALARAEVSELIEAVLGAPVDRLTRMRLSPFGHGNADLDVADHDVMGRAEAHVVLAPMSPHWPATLAAVCRSSILVGGELAGNGRQPHFTRSKGEASVATAVMRWARAAEWRL